MKKNNALIYLASLLALAWVPGSAPAQKQTDVALSVFGAINNGKISSSPVTYESSSDSAGGQLEFRHISNPFLGWDVAYAYSRSDQVYTYAGPTPAGFGPQPPTDISAYAQEFTGNWVFSTHPEKLRMFALAGTGVLLCEPTGSASGSQSFTTPVYVYGAGLDWKTLPHFGLRVQYRGNIHKTPDLDPASYPPAGFTHTAEPAIGVYYKF